MAQWHVEVSKALGKSNGDNVSPSLGLPSRALYATEALLLELSIYPIHVGSLIVEVFSFIVSHSK